MIIRICGAVIIAVFFAYCVFTNNKSLSFAVTAVLCILIAVTAIDNLIPILKNINDISDSSGGEYEKLLMKSFGIGIISSAASSICKRAGENSLSSVVEFFGKTEIIILCMPLLRSLLSLCGVSI